MRHTNPGSGGRAPGLHLDPRTTVLVVLTVSSVLLSPAGSEGAAGLTARWILIVLPGVLFLASGLVVEGLRYAISFAVLAAIPQLVWAQMPGRHAILDVVVTWFGGIALILPGMTASWYLLRTTTASEFIAAMQRMHCPDALTIPASISFRFFPTIGEEYRDIRTAMRMRGLSGMRSPLTMLEYRFVPLLVSVVGIGNELAMSAVTRGLGSGRPRTTLCTIGFRAPDIAALVLLAACLTLLARNGGVLS